MASNKMFLNTTFILNTFLSPIKKISSQGILSLTLITTLSTFTVYSNVQPLCVYCSYFPSFSTGYTQYSPLFLPLLYIGKNDGRLARKRPGDRHSLLLSAAHFKCALFKSVLALVPYCSLLQRALDYFVKLYS